MKRTFSLAILVTSLVSFVSADSFSDDFNRADSPNLTGAWDVLAGDIALQNGEAAGRPLSLGLALAQASGNVRGLVFSMDVRANPGAAFSYAALAVGTSGTGAGQGLFIKIQDNDGDGLFDTYGLYTGNNNPSGFSGAMFGVLNQQTSSAKISAHIEGDVVRLNVQTPGASHDLSAAGVNELVLSDRFGFGLSGSAYADNYSAEAVPEPASLAAIGVGIAALLRRRRR